MCFVIRVVPRQARHKRVWVVWWGRKGSGFWGCRGLFLAAFFGAVGAFLGADDVPVGLVLLDPVAGPEGCDDQGDDGGGEEGFVAGADDEQGGAEGGERAVDGGGALAVWGGEGVADAAFDEIGREQGQEAEKGDGEAAGQVHGRRRAAGLIAPATTPACQGLYSAAGR